MWSVDTMDVYLDVKKNEWIKVVTRLCQIIQSKKISIIFSSIYLILEIKENGTKIRVLKV